MAENFQQSPQIVPVFVNVNPTNPGEQYKSKYKVLGIIQVVLASLSILLGIILISISDYYDTFALIGTGIWCGAIFLVPGILGIISGKSPTTCPIVGAMVTTIISAHFALTMFGMEITAAIVNGLNEDSPSATAIHAILVGISLIVLITAIVHSAYCCAGTSCCCSGNNMVGNQQVIYAPQAGVYPNQVLSQNPGNPAMPVQIVYQGNVGGIQTTAIPQQQQQFAQQQQYFVQQQQFPQQQFIQQQQTVPPQAPPYANQPSPPPLYQLPPQNMNGEQAKLAL